MDFEEVPEIDEAYWPKVHVPLNAELKCSVYTFDYEEKKLEPLFGGMTIDKWIDAEGNRFLAMVTADLPLIGRETCHTYIDFDERRLVKSIPDKEVCMETDIKVDFRMKEYI